MLRLCDTVVGRDSFPPSGEARLGKEPGTSNSAVSWVSEGRGDPALRRIVAQEIQ